ncbi:MAG: sigma-54 dependent transcriptional regulator [Rikenellaceae bacterium]|nr:sigma-54 dependent transcriptional regulator [Rikenellaceae bacterium]
MDIQSVKQRFGIIGSSELLDRALEVALRVAPTDLSVLITGESGVGKEFFPQIIHAFSPRKHSNYIAVNCGAIPEGTIDSELFGHEKGAFTGATDSRKGYFEMANGGTIFLDEVAELPHTTQVRLLRVLQSGEFIKVGSSKVEKTDVRVVAATNVNMQSAIESGRFREDLFYRLATVPITVPSLREREDDIVILFRKFASDIAQQYSMPPISLTGDARNLLTSYSWPGNIRQLKNVAEQLSVIEQTRQIDAATLRGYLHEPKGAPVPVGVRAGQGSASEYNTEREILYKVLFEMRADIADLKAMVARMGGEVPRYGGVDVSHSLAAPQPSQSLPVVAGHYDGDIFDTAEEVTEGHVEKTKEQVRREEILRALAKHGGRRKDAARELFISERTLYRRMKDLGIEQ